MGKENIIASSINCGIAPPPTIFQHTSRSIS